MAKLLNSNSDFLTFKTQADLSINGWLANCFKVTSSSNLVFELTNILIAIPYYILINNNGTADINITLPNTADIKAMDVIVIKPGKYVEVSLLFDGERRIWQVSEELS